MLEVEPTDPRGRTGHRKWPKRWRNRRRRRFRNIRRWLHYQYCLVELPSAGSYRFAIIRR